MPTDALADVLPTPDVAKTLVNGLSAYGRLYGLPNSPEQVQGILATLLRLYQPDRPAIAIDQVAQQVLDGLTPEAITNAVVDRLSSGLAKQVHHWQQHLAQQTEGVLAAYVQRYATTVTPDHLRTLATDVMPLLDNGPITHSEALGLLSQLSQILVPSGVVATVLNPDYLPLAQKLATSLDQQPMTEAVGDTVTAYVEKYAPTLTDISADLIATALGAVLKNQVDFGLDVDLTVVDEQLLIQQVSFNLNILKPSRSLSKTAQAIAADVDAAVKAFQEHPDRGETVDVTTGIERPGGISSSWTSTRPPDDSSTAEDFWEKRRS